MLNKWLNGWSCEGQLEVEVSILKRNWFWHDSVTQISTIDSVRVAPKPSSPKPLPPFSDCHLIMLSLSGAHVWEGLIWFRLCHPSPDSRWWRWGGGVYNEWMVATITQVCQHTCLLWTICEVVMCLSDKIKGSSEAVWDSGFILFVLLAQWGSVSDFLAVQMAP